MSHHDSNLKSLLSPSRSGTFFAPFRSRSANPDGFDSKMKLWVAAIEEWVVSNKKLTLSLKDIHQTFISDAGIRPDKECIRLVFSEMKRRSRLVPLKTLKTSKVWSSNDSGPVLGNFVDPKGWLGWGVTKLVYNPATWAMSALASGQDQTYSDLTDMSITDSMKFVSQKSLDELSQRLFVELIRISKAEKQFCFEWEHLIEIILPIMNTIIDATDGKELLEMLDILIEYLAVRHQVAIQIDNETKLVKVTNPEDSKEDSVTLTKKDIAMARLLRAKEFLRADVDKFHNQSERAKQEALECWNRKEVAKAKSLLRTHKRLNNNAEQKLVQLTNVEILLEQLENTDSNMMILRAYKDGADALKLANTKLDSNTSVIDDLYDATAEANHLNNEMQQMLNNMSLVSQTVHDTSMTDLEAELNEFLSAPDKNQQPTQTTAIDQSNSVDESAPAVDDRFVDELEQRLSDLLVCQDDPISPSKSESRSHQKTRMPSTAT